MFKPDKQARISKRGGQTLVIALIVLGVLLAIGLVFLAIISRSVAQTANSRQRSIASDLAEAGARFAHQQMLHSAVGADYRPAPTTLAPVSGSPDVTRDPDVYYLRPGTHLGLRTDTDPQLDMGGPDGLGPYSRIDFNTGRALIRVRYAPSDANIFSNQATGPLRNPGRARMYTIIETVGRPGKLTFNDPTSANSGNAVQFQNYGTSTQFRTALADMKRFDDQITPSVSELAFVSIGVIDSAEYITNMFQVSRAAELGVPSQLGIVFKNVDVATGKDITTNAQTTTGLSRIFGEALPMYNFDNLNSPTSSPVGVGGSIFSNADLVINGTVFAHINAPLGDVIGTSGLIYGSDQTSTLQIEYNNIDALPPAGTGTYQPPVVTTLTNATNPSLNSRSNTFSTIHGSLRDGVSAVDPDGFSRGLGIKTPPDEFATDPDTGISRPVESTRESGKLVGNGNSGRFGYGGGVYVNNFSDRQIPADEQGRAQVGSSESQAFDWLNPNNGQAGSGWQGPFYVPRGAYLLLVNDGFYITRDSRAPASEGFWNGPDGNSPLDNSGAQVQTGTMRYRIGLGSDGLPHIVNTFTPDPTNPGHAIDINQGTMASSTFDDGPLFNGNLYFEGNVRVRGVIPVDVQLTVVSNATIYVEGSITKSVTSADGTRLSRAPTSMLMLIAHDYVTINTTQFFGPAANQALEPVNDTQSAIAYNPIRMRVGGQPLNFVNEMPLDPLGPGANLIDPSTWRPYALDYQDPTDPSTGDRINSKLLLTHTMDDGPAPSTFFSLDVNQGFNQGPTKASVDPAQDWWYYFQLTNNNAASQPYFDSNPLLTSSDYEPIYGLGVEPWQRYSRFESIAYPLVESDFSYGSMTFSLPNSPKAIVMAGHRPTTGNSPDPEGDYILFSDASNNYQLRHNNVGSDPTNDYLLARAAMAPGDVRIEASMYAETGSFFVIPGPPFNPNPNDRRDVFEAAVTADGGFTSAAAIQQAQQERLENYGSNPEIPFYGEPLDVRITIMGSISENMPAPIDQQAQWIKQWGWIPAQQGCLFDFTGATPRPVLIPKSHVPSGYNIDPASASPSLYVPNLIVSYDPALATARVNGFDTSSANQTIRTDQFGNILPPLPRLPVSPTLAYFGEVNP